MQYHEVRNFGLNLIIKDYANFPRFLPLPCHMEHGWTPLSKALKSDLATDKPLMMVFNKRQAEAWKKKSKIPVEIMGCPFIHYKNKHNITKKADAKGTIAFPGHSTYFLKYRFDIKKYCLELQKLPKEFHPITICLLWLDYIDPTANIYREMGFKVVTAGPKITNSLEFVQKFYDILSSYKYATSNDVGSYSFYAIDMDIPFFLTGIYPVIINKNRRDINSPESSRVRDLKWGKKSIDIFSTGPVQKISKSQREFVEKEMGMRDCLKPEKMHLILRSYCNKNRYWVKAFIPYVISSLWINLVFNGPWIAFLISVRKKMLE